jgi:hypothetical protein
VKSADAAFGLGAGVESADGGNTLQVKFENIHRYVCNACPYTGSPTMSAGEEKAAGWFQSVCGRFGWHPAGLDITRNVPDTGAY